MSQKIATIAPIYAPLARRHAPPVKVTDPFYLRREWRDFVSEIKRQRGYICEDPTCRADMSANRRALIGDHIVERKDGGADYDPLNVRLLCLTCHNRKTSAARERRR